MAALRLALAIVVAALVFPLAAAAPAQGGLDVKDGLHLDGPVSADSSAGALLWRSTQAPDLVLAGEGIHVERFGTRSTVQETPIGGVAVHSSAIDESSDVASGKITFDTGHGEQLVALRDAGALHVEAPGVDVRPVAAVKLASAAGAADSPDGCDVQNNRCLGLVGTYAVSSDETTGSFQGALRLFVMGPAVHVLNANGTEQSFPSGETSSSQATLTTYDDAWVLVTIQKVTGTFTTPPAAAYLDQAALQGTRATADSATGVISVAGKSYHAQGEALEADGTIRLALGPVAPGHFTSGVPTYASGFHADVAGDVTRINLHEAPVFDQRAAEGVGVAAVATVAVGAVAYYWPLLSFHLASFAAPFYTRLRQPEILDNDVRNRIYDIIRANPGISARAVHRESDQSWGTVVYHLRQLERHNLVVSRTMGRTRNYYENHGKYKGMEAQLACLQAPRALTLARVILETPGATQEQLVERSGYPQPTTSYYVRKLRKAGLIEEAREGRYVRYLPAQDLARFVQAADPRPLGAPASAVLNA